ncbi:hypothetical protein BaRGS_00027271 [Batillaria attramentaria]|uniref:Uncharacterized protein n=1 Tax=Batillaria attramentaria TaxID=370345 RepID=A0ABD0K2P9_9CAEN
MLSLVTPARSIAFVIPKRDQSKRGANKRRQNVSTEVVSRLSDEAKAFLVIQPLVQGKLGGLERRGRKKLLDDEVRVRRYGFRAGPNGKLLHSNGRGVKTSAGVSSAAEEAYVTVQKGTLPCESADPLDHEHEEAECALKQAYQEARHFHKRLVVRFRQAQLMFTFKRYHRLRAIIKEATREQHLLTLRQGARRQCTCSARKSRVSELESPEGSGTGWCVDNKVCDIAHVLMSAWGKLESLARSVIATAVPAYTPDPNSSADPTTPTPTCADHFRYRSRIILLQRHLEKLGRDYEKSKRSWLITRRYSSMKAMLERVAGVRMD